MSRRVWSEDGSLTVKVTQVTGNVEEVELKAFLAGVSEKKLTETLRAIADNPGSTMMDIQRITGRHYRQARDDAHALAAAGLVDLGSTRPGVGGGLRALVGPNSFHVEFVYDDPSRPRPEKSDVPPGAVEITAEMLAEIEAEAAAKSK